MIFESIILSQLSENNTRNRAIDRTERGTFWDDLLELVEEVEREDALHKEQDALRKKIKRTKRKQQELRAKKESTDGLPKYDRPSGQWVDVETGEIIE